MNKIFSMVLIMSILSIVIAKTASPFTGTWCIGGERLIIEFLGTDSIHISSRADESVNGSGTYTKNDTNFTATLINDDLTLNMGYRYEMKDADNLKAKITFFTIDGDSVDHPKRWLRMERCSDPDSYDFDAATKNEEK